VAARVVSPALTVQVVEPAQYYVQGEALDVVDSGPDDKLKQVAFMPGSFGCVKGSGCAGMSTPAPTREVAAAGPGWPVVRRAASAASIRPRE
jgi:hypothetical protein